METETGASKIDEIRTSDGMFFNRAEDPVIEGRRFSAAAQQHCG